MRVGTAHDAAWAPQRCQRMFSAARDPFVVSLSNHALREDPAEGEEGEGARGDEEDAPVADIREDGTNEGESALLSAATRAGYYHGQRVRIVPDAGQGGVDHG